MKDYFEVDHITYQALQLDPVDAFKGLGINSSVFRARRADDSNAPSIMVKVCNYGNEQTTIKFVQRRARFAREIDAMKKSIEHGKSNLVVKILGDGLIRVSHRDEALNREWISTHRCFIMEAADSTLRDHLDKERDLSFQQKLLLCCDLVGAVRALHQIEIYHRDIKPENIFLFGSTWKIGDLGLIAYRGEDADLEREKVGPPTWMSPEAFNKAYCVLRANNEFIDRQLDERSDVYQLGKLCWHILQGDIPNGCLKSSDWIEGGEQVYGSFLKPMLGYKRHERPTLADIQRRLVPIMRLHSL